MQVAQDAVNGTYGAIWPHLKLEDTGNATFTLMEPGPFTEMIASACAIAQLELPASAAGLVGWDVRERRFTSCWPKRELNETSANSGSVAGGLDSPDTRDRSTQHDLASYWPTPSGLRSPVSRQCRVVRLGSGG